MKGKPTWMDINIKGLSKYQISDTQTVRLKESKRIIKSGTLQNGDKVVNLQFWGADKTFQVKWLMVKVFAYKEDDNTPNIKIPPNKAQFSENEDDYGKGVNTQHWKDLKYEMKNLGWVAPTVSNLE